MKAKYTLIVPAYNEEAVLDIFYKTVTPVMEGLNEPYEILFINDGSRDSTLNILRSMADKDKRVKVLSFARNFGQQAAIFAGLENATGDAVIMMDADLQDPIEAVPQMIEKWKQGFEIVHGKRSKRKGETFFKKFTSKLYLKFLQAISGLKIPQDVGEFKLLDRKVVDTINSMPEHNKYLRALTSWVGYKQTEVEFVRNERAAGETKYSLKKLVKLAGNGIISFSTWPLQLPMILGIGLNLASLICYLVFIILACCKIVLASTIWLYPFIALIASIILIASGFSNIYLRRTYEETRNRPKHIIAEKINMDVE